MEATQATAMTGEPVDSESIAGAGAAAAAKQVTPPDTVPVPRPSGAVRLDENRTVLRSEEVREDVLEPRAWWDKPGIEAALAGAAAVAGGLAVALLRRALQHRRHKAA
jgi:hypothetical protein